MESDNTCSKCGKIFKNKYALFRHANRKTSCVDNENIYKCDNCSYKCKRKSLLDNHIKKKKCSQYNITTTHIPNQMALPIEINNNVNGDNNNITNNNYITNNVNNTSKIINKTYINIVAYGKEDISFMSEDDVLHFLFMGVMSIPELVKFIHFNKDKPEFHNIYISNIKSNFAKRYDGLKWNICDKNDAIEEEYMRACDFLENMYIEYKEKGMLGELTKTKMDKFIIRKDNKDYVEKMAAKILMILYNNRDIVEETIRKNKQLGR